ncbi:hypothetical protein EJ02DRAFT_467146 [Clathrospora elynae]|uniref:Uncharacterized protein n=1 Tax=Clathrospora elynae TaxID=706981 RepID=A0A6A5SMQ9_9PLEO|nr:hypothetical protein EJ02DRAFT_467146 [Clathrospora elynae]
MARIRVSYSGDQRASAPFAFFALSSRPAEPSKKFCCYYTLLLAPILSACLVLCFNRLPPMADFPYFDAGGNGRHFQNGQSLNLNFASANTLELSVQHQIKQQQLLSPTTHHRHDSMFQCSPSNTPRPSISQHQAETQPFANTHGTMHVANSYSQRPVNTCMSRSTSQYSSTSSGHPQYNGHQHRASRSSFGSNPLTGASEMSRSYSNASTVQQATPQPNATQPRPVADDNLSRQPSQLSSTTSPDPRYGPAATGAMDLSFDFVPDDIIGGGLAGSDDGNRSFGQMQNTSE